MLETTHLRTHLDQLAEKKFAVLSVEVETARALLESAKRRLQMHQFRDAMLADVLQATPQVRNDQIFWLDAKLTDLAPIESEILIQLDSVLKSIKQSLFIPVNHCECHYAYYPAGHYYRKHRDTKLSENKRLLSFVLYLNENWNAADGGELVGYEEDKVLFRVLPELGRLIIFRSEVEHEVIRTQRDRFSFTGWFRC